MKACGLDVHKDSIFCAIYDGKTSTEVKTFDSMTKSMVPNPTIQELRFYTRKYSKLQQEKSRLLTKMDRLMVMSNIRISSCVSKLSNKSVIQIIEALIHGRKILVIVWNMLKEKKPYNPNLVRIYDPMKVERKLAYHRMEMEKAAKLLHKEIVL